MLRSSLFLIAVTLGACSDAAQPEPVTPTLEVATNAHIRTAAFVAVDGVYNSELMAPYDVLHHSIFRDSLNYIRPFVVSPDGEPVVTFEGLTVSAHYGFENAPRADILVIPSAEGSMTTDLEDEWLIDWIREAAITADWVITVCDGAFPLAATGLLDGRTATTFPSDREALAEMFPSVYVRDDARLVVDGKFITSVGGGMSYEPAFYLVERLYGPEHARLTAEGLVWPWELETMPHVVVDAE
ncbi:MAG: DJ-1/PfpI family protein [Bacteroidetes bacterium]|nr:DJ-1/PfpI family protein [Bacteroidota bacterium]